LRSEKKESCLWGKRESDDRETNKEEEERHATGQWTNIVIIIDKKAWWKEW